MNRGNLRYPSTDAEMEEFYKSGRQKLFETEIKNQSRREQEYKNMLAFASVEEQKRNDELAERIKLLNRQSNLRQLQWQKEVEMEKKARRELMRDRQMAADLNLDREKRRLATLEKHAMSYLHEVQQNADERHRGRKTRHAKETENYEETEEETDKITIVEITDDSDCKEETIEHEKDEKAPKKPDEGITECFSRETKDQSLKPSNSTDASISGGNQDEKINKNELCGTDSLKNKEDDNICLQTGEQENDKKSIKEQDEKMADNSSHKKRKLENSILSNSNATTVSLKKKGEEIQKNNKNAVYSKEAVLTQDEEMNINSLKEIIDCDQKASETQDEKMTDISSHMKGKHENRTTAASNNIDPEKEGEEIQKNDAKLIDAKENDSSKKNKCLII